MPIYSFFCESCNLPFEVNRSRDKAGQSARCPACHSEKHTYRDYVADDVSLTEGPKTLGSLADRNTGKLSIDERANITHKLDPKKKRKEL
jgi:putative FmdB family regulatory protein